MARVSGQLKTFKLPILASTCVVVAALYFAQEVLMPLATSVLLCFLLTPLVARLERNRIPRVAAVVIVVSVLIVVLLALFIAMGTQVKDLAEQLPSYQSNIVEKLKVVQPSKDSFFQRTWNAVQGIQKAVTEPATQPVTIIAPTSAPPGSTPAVPMYVNVIAQSTGSSVDTISAYLSTVLGPLGTAGMILIFVIFMLLQREDLRDRVIRLVGEGQLYVTTQAIDDATNRISRYLIAQSIVNGTYGLAISLCLLGIGYFVGDNIFPNFLLWGLICAVLRFIPYIGAWIAAAFPLLIAFAVYHGYGVFVSVIVMFVVIELLSNNLMEPWLYAASTGLSTVAVLVSAVFWTWLWGPMGLLLATPLTVCIVVLGKHVPQFSYLDILLGDEPVLEPHQRLYQRLLASDVEEASELA